MAEEEKKEEQEFKPVAPTEQTDEQRKKVAWIYNHWKNDPIVKKHPEWEEEISFAYGDQYVIYVEETGKLENIEPLVERETKNTYNRTTPLCRQAHGELIYNHQYYIQPNTMEQNDVRAAKVGSAAVEYTNEEGKFNQKIKTAKWWSVVIGNIYWKEWWNENLSGRIKKDDGETVEEPGECDYGWVSAFNCRPDPLAKTRAGWRWFIEGNEVPKSSVEQEFELEDGILPIESRDSEDAAMQKKTEDEIAEEPKSIRIECWERPSPKYPRGRFLVVAGNWLLYDGENPAPRHQIPYWQCPGVLDVLNQPNPIGITRLAIPMQRQFNKQNSEIDEHNSTFGIKGMIPFGSMRPHDEKSYKRGGVEYVTYNPRMGTPHYQNTPAISDTVMSHRDFVAGEMEHVTSIRKISLAEWQKGVRGSGVLFERLKGQDERILMPIVQDWDDMLKEPIKYRLELIQKHYTIERLIKTVGKNKRTSITEFKGAQLRDNRDVRSSSGIELFTTKKAKEDIIMAFVEKGFIQEPRKALELLDMDKGLEEYMEDEFVDERQAHRHLELMKNKDDYIEASDDDNHDVHFRVFNNFRKSEEFDSLSKERQANIRKRIDKHKEFLGTEEAAAPTEEGAVTGEVPAPVEEVTPAPEIAPAMAAPTPEISPDYMAILMDLLAQGGGY